MDEIERWMDVGSVNNLCVKCSEGEDLLICSSTKCPIVVHKRCLGCPASFDGDGNFRCPYCVAVLAEEDLLRARRECISKRDALVTFIRLQAVGGAKESEEYHMDESNNRPKHSENGSEKINGSLSDGSKGRDHGVEGEESLRKKQRTRNDVEGRTREDEPGTSLGHVYSAEVTKHKAIYADVANSQEKEIPVPRCETIPEDKNITYPASEDQGSSLKNSKDQSISKHPGQDLSIIVYSTPLNPQKISFRAPASVENENVSSYRFDPSASAEQQPTSSLDTDFLVTRKSKRVMWRLEEVEMLKKGVQEFSREHRNIPWRKILEYGHEVFDVNRTPSDLKEKWKKVSKA